MYISDLALDTLSGWPQRLSRAMEHKYKCRWLEIWYTGEHLVLPLALFFVPSVSRFILVSVSVLDLSLSPLFSAFGCKHVLSNCCTLNLFRQSL